MSCVILNSFEEREVSLRPCPSLSPPHFEQLALKVEKCKDTPAGHVSGQISSAKETLLKDLLKIYKPVLSLHGP